VEAARLVRDEIYVQSASLNGQPLDRPWISHSEITGGGLLRLVMGAQPNQKWAAGGIPED
jgi:putative alpha-1,2-mannosidase